MKWKKILIKQKEDGKTEKLYHHKVLEAKIVMSDHVVISLGTEFIENEKEDVEKEDCELNAAKRLMEKTSRQKLLDESYEWLKNGDGAEQIKGLCKEKGTRKMEFTGLSISTAETVMR